MHLSINRTSFKIFVLIGLLNWSSAFGQLPADQKGLKDYYLNYFPIGVAVTPAQLADSVQRKFILKHFNSLTAENAMKMEPIHPEEKRYFWNDADAIVNFAQRHGLKVRGHTLCWYNQTPKWMFYDSSGVLVGKKVLLQRLKDHINAVVGRYRGKVYAWDVVNEAVADEPGRLMRNSLWYQICGEDFVEKAFQYAHEADPEAILFYNDYNTELPGKKERICQLLKKLRDKDIPVHAIGLQGHWSISNPVQDQLQNAIKMYASIGLKVQVTELDVSIYVDGNTPEQVSSTTVSAFTPDREQRQAAQYGSFFKVFRAHVKDISGVTFWNLSDGHSWLDNFPVRGRKNYPLLFDQQLKPKKAYWDVVSF